jgi:hypothetical protein
MEALLAKAYDDANFSCSYLRHVLESNCDVNAREPKPPGRCLLHVAAALSCEKCCPSQLLIKFIQRGAKVDALDDDGETPLMKARLTQVNAYSHSLCKLSCRCYIRLLDLRLDVQYLAVLILQCI